MNRGTGLILARQRLRRHPLDADDADFIGRNIAKAQLAFGDAVLTARGGYHWSCLERHRRLLALPQGEAPAWFEELRQHHAAGLQFKLHPRRSSPKAEPLRRDYERVAAFMLPVWLWIESRRLGQEFRSAREYIASTVDKWPGTNGWRNRLLNAWICGPAAFFFRRSGRHPRERVLNAMAMLLWDNDNLETRLPAVLRNGLPKVSTIVAQVSNPRYVTPHLGPCLDPVEPYRRLWEHVR
jgi:hypothetical protein